MRSHTDNFTQDEDLKIGGMDRAQNTVMRDHNEKSNTINNQAPNQTKEQQETPKKLFRSDRQSPVKSTSSKLKDV